MVASFINFGVSLVSGVVNTFFQIGFIKLMLNVVRAKEGATPELGDLFSGFPFFLPVILASIVTGICVFFGFLLLIVPGVILSLGWMFTATLRGDK